MIMIKKALFWVAIVLFIIIGSGCLSTSQEPELMPIEATPISTPVVEGPFIDYLGVSDKACGKCHTTAFASISQEGGGHDKGCTFCHFQHGIKPKCTDCHELIHGTQLQDCKECHDEHAPMGITFSLDLESSCSLCHPLQIDEFSDHPGRHADLKCSYCHQTHRQIEACTNCHAPHGQTLAYTECMTCHPAHFPQEIDYLDSVDTGNCAFCHEEVSTTLEQSTSIHSILECAYCHPVHAQIPDCMDCHTKHMANIDCLACHPAHEPLTMEFPEGTLRDNCTDCHKQVDDILSGSNTIHNDLGCIYCHPKHRYLPTCDSCHGLPHKKIHEDYPECAQCHIVSHDVKEIVFTK